MTSPRSRPRVSASLGLIQAAVSHVSFVSGFGASCSQPLLAKRPSQTVGSGRKTSSSPPARAGAGGGVGAREPAAGAGVAGAGGAACAARRSRCGRRSCRRSCHDAWRGGSRTPALQAPSRAPAVSGCRRSARRGRRAADESVVEDLLPERVSVAEGLAVLGPRRPPTGAGEAAGPVALDRCRACGGPVRSSASPASRAPCGRRRAAR